MRAGTFQIAGSILVLAGIATAHSVRAQVSGDQFGVQSRANAANEMIVLAVQQGISSLPPTTGQTFTYEFNRELSTFVPSERMGPTSFRSPQTIGEGRFSLRGAFSYFEASQTFGPIDYKVTGKDFPDPPGYCTRFGVDVSAAVGLFNFGVTYGITNRIEADFNLPVVVTDVSGKEIFYSDRPAFEEQVAVDKCSVFPGSSRPVSLPFQNVQLPQGSVDFNHGTSAGVGRMSLGAKISLYENDRVQLAFAPEFFFPSPSQDAYAGSGTGAVLPRVIAQIVALPQWRFHVDAGYDYDYELAELRRFTWNTGTSWATAGEHAFTVDLGVGGSQFDQGIEWSPQLASFSLGPGEQPGQIRALSSTRLGTTFVDFLGGIKVRVAEHVAVSGAVNVPLNSQGFRADAVGTFAAEYYF